VPGATGLRAGGPLDAMLPGADLAWHLAAARRRGLGALTDDELIGVLAAARRARSWQAERELAATGELDARRAGPDGRDGEHVEDERPGGPIPGGPVPGAFPAPFPGAPFPGAAPGAPASGWLNGVNLTIPLTAWLGLAGAPGEISGTGAAGPADAATCRDLAGLLAGGPATRWCVTLTGQAGRAVAHGCARAGPGPPGTGPPGAGRRAWLASVTITPIEAGPACAHRHQSAGYRPPATLRHRVKTRSPRCGFPGCRRPARRCDDDHTITHHQGGKTCECNLYPLCRHHHRCKQAPGWHLAQPRPGVLVWTTPSGRQHTITAEPYPV
jgi:hypothetical protein